MTRLVTIVLLAGALAAAVVGWTRTSSSPSIRIVDVRPLATTDPNLRDLLAHHLAVRVQKTHARWSLYVDGHPIEESTAKVIDTPYLTPGPHWLAARLQRKGVWSEPVTLHMPRAR
jgi:hypothetical protein